MIPFEGTSEMITSRHMRHFIMREEPTGARIATWINAMNEVADTTRLGIPEVVAANSKNETGGIKLGGSPEDQPFTQWPGTLGLAARSEEHTSELQSRGHLVCRLLLEKKN